MKKHFTFISVLLFTVTSYGQVTPPQNTYEQLKKGGDFYGFNFMNPQTGYITKHDRNNHVSVTFKTIDGGKTWTEYTRISDVIVHTYKDGKNVYKDIYHPYRISFINDSVWTAITYDPVVGSAKGIYFLKTTDTGKTWKRVNNLASYKIYKNADGTPFAYPFKLRGIPNEVKNDVVEHPDQYKVVHQKKNEHDEADFLYLMNDLLVECINFTDENTGYIGGYYKLYQDAGTNAIGGYKIPFLAKTLDGGLTWTLMTGTFPKEIIESYAIVKDISIKEDAMEVTIGHGGPLYIIRTQNDGVKWITAWKNPELK